MKGHIPNNVKIVLGDFGARFDFEMPKDCTHVLLCHADGHGVHGGPILLPHQIYVDTVERLLQDQPQSHRIVIIPLGCAEDFQPIWTRYLPTCARDTPPLFICPRPCSQVCVHTTRHKREVGCRDGSCPPCIPVVDNVDEQNEGA